MRCPPTHFPSVYTLTSETRNIFDFLYMEAIWVERKGRETVLFLHDKEGEQAYCNATKQQPGCPRSLVVVGTILAVFIRLYR